MNKMFSFAILLFAGLTQSACMTGVAGVNAREDRNCYVSRVENDKIVFRALQSSETRTVTIRQGLYGGSRVESEYMRDGRPAPIDDSMIRECVRVAAEQHYDLRPYMDLVERLSFRVSDRWIDKLMDKIDHHRW